MQLLGLSCVWLLVLLAQTQASNLGAGMTKQFTPTDLGFVKGEIDLNDSDGSIAKAEGKLNLSRGNLNDARDTFNNATNTFKSEKATFTAAKKAFNADKKASTAKATFNAAKTVFNAAKASYSQAREGIKPAMVAYWDAFCSYFGTLSDAVINKCNMTAEMGGYTSVLVGAAAPCFQGGTNEAQPRVCDCAAPARAAGKNSFSFSDGVCKFYDSLAVADGGNEVEIFTLPERLQNSQPTATIVVNPGLSSLSKANATVTWALNDTCNEVEKMVITYTSMLSPIGNVVTLDRASYSSADNKVWLKKEEVCTVISLTFKLYNANDALLYEVSWMNDFEYTSFNGIKSNVIYFPLENYGDDWQCFFMTDLNKTQSEAMDICSAAGDEKIFEGGMSDAVMDNMFGPDNLWLGLTNPKDGSSKYQWYNDANATLAFDDSIWSGSSNVSAMECAYLNTVDFALQLVAADCDEIHNVLC